MNDIPVMILCGGKGTRLRDISELLPKPMVPIGGKPILWHIMSFYAAHGFKRFILCLGYKGDVIRDYFSNSANHIGWDISFAETGLESQTGLRVKLAAEFLNPNDTTFFLTYGDGVSNIDIKATLETHRRLKRLITVCAVHPPARFGEMVIVGDAVTEFREKPAVTHDYINGGYMVVERGLIDKYLSEERNESFEFGVMQAAAHNGDMSVFKHEGFWQCMDTPREHSFLNDLMKNGTAPWRIWLTSELPAK